MKIKFTIILLFACLQLSAQNNLKLSFACFDEDSNAITDFYSRIINGDSTSFALNKDNYTLNGKGPVTLVIGKFGYFEKRLVLRVENNVSLNIVLMEKAIEQNGYVLKATRVDKNSAYAYTDISAKELNMQNLGQDFTYLIGNTPSTVTTSDAGAGVGYTGIRIRGSDATRINVTINGIPINDAESHGVYWVNIPDLASSINSVQVQRGVGTSTNGNGSFGANISINNIENSTLPGLQIQQSYGSFNTFKSNLKFSTGKMGNFSFNGRLSKIMSDGYIDRASSDLSAFQFNLNYYNKGWAIYALSFGGKEKTYQSWYGTPQSRFENDKEAMQKYSDRNYLSPAQHDNLMNSGRTYNYYTYKNQTDNYGQNHYQFHIGKELCKSLAFKTSFFTTTGKGYYEEFKEGAKFSSYGVSNFITLKDTILSTDLVRQKWLDNIYYGNFTSIDYARNKLKVSAGFGITGYKGKHFGKVVWAEIAKPFGNDYRYYNEKSRKDEMNGFAKIGYQASRKLNLLAELQVRQVNYRNDIITSDSTSNLQFNQSYTFFNPKAGLNYQLKKNHQVYASFSMGNREPIRSDFKDNPDSTLPKPEQLQDFELGWINKGKTHFIQVNGYYMNYASQLVLTGAVNDVGAPLRQNVKESYRLGIELVGMKSILRGKMILEGNLTLSRNKIKDFSDVYYDYGYTYDTVTTVKVDYKNTDISFSPGIIGYLGITDKHIKNLQIGLNLKYVGDQYMDNTANGRLVNSNSILNAKENNSKNSSAKLKNYSTLNMHFQYQIKLKSGILLAFKGAANNVFSTNYTNNGYKYKYLASNILVDEIFYYPQSFINFMLGVDVKF